MHKRLLAGLQVFKNLGREIHKILKIMDPAPRYKVIFFGKRQSFGQVLQQCLVYLPIEDKACSSPLLPILYPFFQFMNDVGVYIIIYFQFSITCYLYYVA